MARARNIKPGVFKNELLGSADGDMTNLFIGLWMLADREGRLEDRPKRIKAEVFPYREVDVDSRLTWLSEQGFIRRYEAKGFHVIQIVYFLKHQKPHGTEKDSALPDEKGLFTVHERSKTGCATGRSSVVTDPNNVAATLDNVKSTLPNSELTVKPLLDNALNPYSLNPSSLNPDSSVPNGTGGQAAEAEPVAVAQPVQRKPLEPVEIIFGYGLPVLVNAGTPEKQARTFLGGLRKEHGDIAVVNALRECLKEKPLQPLEWLAAALSPRRQGVGRTQNKQEALEARNRAIADLWFEEVGNA